MDKISIPEQDVVALEGVAPQVAGLRVLIVNVYAISEANGEWMLIDCGLPHSAGRIRRWAHQRFGESRPQAILLTHGHFDHAGSVEELATGWNVPVFVHLRSTTWRGTSTASRAPRTAATPTALPPSRMTAVSE